MRSQPLLEATNLQKSFGGVYALRGASLSVAPGSRLGIIGPNGSGKSTLMNVLSGYLPPDSGQVRLLGRDVTRAPASKRAALGIARTFQIAAVIHEWSVYENIAFAASLQSQSGLRSSIPLTRNRQIKQQSQQAAEKWGVAAELHTRVSELSYGLVRRTELAIATLGKPAVLLLDEPAAGLSEEGGAEVVQIADELFPDAAIVLVEHDMNIVFAVCEQVLVLENGKPIAHGSPDHIRNDDQVKAAYLGAEL